MAKSKKHALLSPKTIKEVHDLDTGRVEVHVEIETKIGRKVVEIQRQLMHKPKSVLDELAASGSVHSIEDTLGWLNDDHRDDHMIVERKTAVAGWHGSTLLTRCGSFPTSSDDTALFMKPTQYSRPYSRRGTLQENVEGLSSFLSYSPYLTLAYAVGLTPAMLQRAGVREGFALCYSGKSTTGKTTTELLIASLSGEASGEGVLVEWADTLGVILSSSKIFPGIATPFSDFKAGRESPAEFAKKIQALTFAGTIGKTRRRQDDPIDVTNQAGVNVYVYVSEIPLEDIYRAGNLEFGDGDRVRNIDIRVPARENGGIFPNLRQAESLKLATELQDFLRSRYGNIIPAWAKVLAEENEKSLKKRFIRAERGFVKRHGLSDGFTRRMAGLFIWSCVASRLARKHKMLPVPYREARDAIGRLFIQVLESDRSRLLQQRRDRDFVLNQLLDESIFPLLTGGVAPIDPEKASFGFRRRDGGKVILYVSHRFFAHLVEQASVVDAEALRLWLCEQTLNGRPSDRMRKERTTPVKQSGLQRQRYLAFKLSDIKKLKENY